METQQSLHNMKTIVCTVNKVVFHDQKSGNVILNAIRDNGRSCRLLGKIQTVAEGTVLEATGVWEQDKKYGWQFVAESFQESSQEDNGKGIADDTMMHALDFSNILNKKVKEFRILDLRYDDDSSDNVGGTSKRKKKTSKLSFPTIKADDGATYNQKMTILVSAPRRVSSFVIPDTVRCINNNAFLNCGLKNITIPDSVVVIGDRTFAGCKNLSRAVFPGSVRVIGTNLFDGCSKLTSIRLSQDVKGVNGYVFYDCPELTSVEIPGCEVSIEYDASYGCKYIRISKASTFRKKEIVTPKPTTGVTDKTIELDWKDVDFHYGYIRIPNQLGGYTIILDDNVDYTINPLVDRLTKLVSNLVVHFDHEGHPSLINVSDLHDAVITLRIKNDLAALIRSGYKPSEILDKLDRLPRKYKRILEKRDKSPYINFLFEQHASGKYPFIPIEERINKSKEKGTLFTVMIDGQPNIVWENDKDSRSSYVFRCTEEDYIETRQLVFDYVMADETGKRKLLHSDECTSIFKEKPRAVVHNSLTSWAQRLMCDSDLIVELEDPVYNTTVCIEDIEGELGDMTYQEYDVSVNASVRVDYYKYYDGKKQLLLSCTFTVYETISGDFSQNMSEWDMEDFCEEGDVDGIVNHMNIDDFKGLNALDLFALGVPTSGEGMNAEEIGYLLSKSLNDAGIDWSCGEFKCTKLFSKEELAGDFGNI